MDRFQDALAGRYAVAWLPFFAPTIAGPGLVRQPSSPLRAHARAHCSWRRGLKAPITCQLSQLSQLS
jgi:hypothetical protein